MEWFQEVKIEGLCLFNKMALKRGLRIEERVNIDLLKALSTGNINFSQRKMLVVSLLCYVNIVEYEDPFEDEDNTKVVTFCIECITLKAFPESFYERRGVISPLSQCTLACNCTNTRNRAFRLLVCSYKG